MRKHVLKSIKPEETDHSRQNWHCSKNKLEYEMCFTNLTISTPI